MSRPSHIPHPGDRQLLARMRSPSRQSSWESRIPRLRPLLHMPPCFHARPSSSSLPSNLAQVPCSNHPFCFCSLLPDGILYYNVACVGRNGVLSTNGQPDEQGELCYDDTNRVIVSFSTQDDANLQSDAEIHSIIQH